MELSKVDGDYHLSTGRSIYAHAGILGLSPREPGVLYYGYDGVVQDDEMKDAALRFTPAERQEIAAFMVDLWQKWGGLPA